MRIHGTDRGLFSELNKILTVNQNFPVEIKRFKQIGNKEHGVSESAIVIIESEDFWEIFRNKHFIDRDYAKSMKFFIFIKKAKVKDL